MGVTDAAEILVFLIWQLLHWLLFGCKNSQNIQKRPGDLFAKGQSGDAAGPNRRFHQPVPMGCRAVAPPNSVNLRRRQRQHLRVQSVPDKRQERQPDNVGAGARQLQRAEGFAGAHLVGRARRHAELPAKMVDTDVQNGSGWWHWSVFNILASVHRQAPAAKARRIYPRAHPGSDRLRIFALRGAMGPPVGDHAHHYEIGPRPFICGLSKAGMRCYAAVRRWGGKDPSGRSAPLTGGHRNTRIRPNHPYGRRRWVSAADGGGRLANREKVARSVPHKAGFRVMSLGAVVARSRADG
jgi:hypothetical protein